MSGLLLFMAIFAMTIQMNGAALENTTLFQSSPSAADYTSVDPIEIFGGADWAAYPFITGTGSENDPYIIANVEITGGVENRTYEGDRSAYGIAIYDSSAVFTIQNCKVTNWHIGIFCLTLGSLTSKIIQQNDISYCGIGINVYGENFTITSNTIEECHTDPENRLAMIYTLGQEGPFTYGGAGIYVDFVGNDLEISYNTIRNCEVGIVYTGSGWLRHNQLENCGVLFDRPKLYYVNQENNTVNGLPLGFFTFLPNLTLDGKEQQYGQLVIAGCENVELSNLEISQTSIGIQIAMTNNFTMTDVTVEECLLGVSLFDYSPFIPGFDEHLIVDKLELGNCLVGLQMMVRDSQVPDTVYTTEFTISKATDNEYDILLGPSVAKGINITAPAGVKVRVDGYGLPMEVVVELDGAAYDQVEIVTSLCGYLDSIFNATIITMEDVGEYSIVSERLLLQGDTVERIPFHNLTIIVVSAGFSIPGFDLGMLGWSVTIGSVIGLATIHKKRFL